MITNSDALYEVIAKRRSVRRYDMTPLSSETLSKVQESINTLTPLDPSITTHCELINADKAKGLFVIKAPHYLIISSEPSDGYLINVGFMFQQMDLILSAMGLGSCWVGMARPNESLKTELTFVIVLAFGTPNGSPYREFSGFRRKAFDAISEGNDPRIESVRLAPSASNTQTWFLIADSGALHLYRLTPSALKAKLYDKMNQVDTGIALCHLFIASAHLDMPFSFVKLEGAPVKKGYSYMGTIPAS